MKKLFTSIFAIILSLGIFAQNDTMFVHTKTGIVEIATAQIDSIVFYRTQQSVTPPPNFAHIKINEVSGVGSDAEKFYELINIGPVPINLAGFTLEYNANSGAGGVFPPNGNQGITWTGCSTQVIQPGGLLVLMGRNGGDTPPAQRDPCSFRTGLTAQRILIITLRDPNGVIIDRCIRARDLHPYAFRDRSFSRIPDGTGPFYFTNSTPGVTNGTNTTGLTLLPQTPEGQEPPNTDSIRAMFYKHPVFDLDTLASITLEVSVEQWNKMLQEFDINSHNKEKYNINFIYNKGGRETRINNMAFRLRGNTSRRRPEGNTGQLHNPSNPQWRNAHFLLDFRENDRNQRFHGLERLVLKWHKDDATYCREVFGYDLMRRFGVWTAPRVAYTRVFIKVGNLAPAYFGLYVTVEHPREIFAQNRHAAGFFDSPDGDLWSCNLRGGPHGGNADLARSGARNKMGVEDVRLNPAESVYFSYDLKTNRNNIDAAANRFVRWIDSLNLLTGDAFKTWITANLDVDLFLRALAVEIAIGHWDNFWGNANNYYLYFESTTGKAYYIPWDLDNTLGTWNNSFFNPGTEDVLRWGGSNRVLATKILGIPEFRQQYITYLNELIDSEKDLFHIDRSIPRIQKWHQMVGPHVKPQTLESSETAHTIIDRPATWGNSHYRIFERGSRNFFEAKTTTIRNTSGTNPGAPDPQAWVVGFSGDAFTGVGSWVAPTGATRATYSTTQSNITNQQTGAGTYVWTINSLHFGVGTNGFKLRIDRPGNNPGWYGWQEFTITGDSANFVPRQSQGGDIRVSTARTYRITITVVFDGHNITSTTVNFQIAT